jgi:hypothetical protein
VLEQHADVLEQLRGIEAGLASLVGQPARRTAHTQLDGEKRAGEQERRDVAHPLPAQEVVGDGEQQLQRRGGDQSSSIAPRPREPGEPAVVPRDAETHAQQRDGSVIRRRAR